MTNCWDNGKLLEVEYSAFTVLDVMNVVKKMKIGKCPGPDGIHMEAFHYGGIFINTFVAQFQLSTSVKELWKSANI